MDWDADETQWRRALGWYKQALSLHEESHGKKEGLCALEEELHIIGAKVRTRDPCHITGDEYSTLVKWKLKRGKWRPRLQGFADALGGEIVKEQSEKALKALDSGKTRGAISALVDMRGCGPATASGVLAFIDSSVPFMGDELLECVPVFGGRRDYTLKIYMTLVDQVGIKVNQLGGDWNACKIEHAVFAAAVAKRLGRESELNDLNIKKTSDIQDEGDTKGNGESRTKNKKREQIRDGKPAVEDDADEKASAPAHGSNDVKSTRKKKRIKVADVAESSEPRRTSSRLRKKNVN